MNEQKWLGNHFLKSGRNVQKISFIKAKKHTFFQKWYHTKRSTLFLGSNTFF